jgi:hypothetical protein
MKGSITILLVAVLIATPVLFSNACAEGLIGVKGGLTVSDWWGKDSGGPDMKGGFVGGVFFTHMLNTKLLLFENIGIQPELLFHRKGVKEVYMDIELTWTLDYLEIPILFKAEIPPTASSSKGYLLIGPAFAYNLNSKIRAEYLGESDEEDAGDLTKSMDIGFVLGLSASFDMGSFDLLFDLRYTLGLLTIDDEFGETVRNYTISLIVGVALPYGRTS